MTAKNHLRSASWPWSDIVRITSATAPLTPLTRAGSVGYIVVDDGRRRFPVAGSKAIQPSQLEAIVSFMRPFADHFGFTVDVDRLVFPGPGVAKEREESEKVAEEWRVEEETYRRIQERVDERRRSEPPAESSSPIAIEVLPRRRPSGLVHFLRLLLTLGRYEYWLMSRPDYEARVVAKNRAGHTFLLFRVANDDEAEEKAARLRAELATAPSLEGWCDRYVVPSGFIEGTWQPEH